MISCSGWLLFTHKWFRRVAMVINDQRVFCWNQNIDGNIWSSCMQLWVLSCQDRYSTLIEFMNRYECWQEAVNSCFDTCASAENAVFARELSGEFDFNVSRCSINAVYRTEIFKFIFSLSLLLYLSCSSRCCAICCPMPWNALHVDLLYQYPRDFWWSRPRQNYYVKKVQNSWSKNIQHCQVRRLPVLLAACWQLLELLLLALVHW